MPRVSHTGEIIETMVATQARCDVGAIDRINLWTPERKLPLSQRQIEQWFEQDKTPRSLIVQLFTFDEAIAGVAVEERKSLMDQLHALGCSTREQTLGKGQHATDYLLVNLAATSKPTTVADAWRTRLDPATRLLRESFVVRSIALPAHLIESALPDGHRLNLSVRSPRTEPDS